MSNGLDVNVTEFHVSQNGTLEEEANQTLFTPWREQNFSPNSESLRPEMANENSELAAMGPLLEQGGQSDEAYANALNERQKALAQVQVNFEQYQQDSQAKLRAAKLQLQNDHLWAKATVQCQEDMVINEEQVLQVNLNAMHE